MRTPVSLEPSDVPHGEPKLTISFAIAASVQFFLCLKHQQSELLTDPMLMLASLRALNRAFANGLDAPNSLCRYIFLLAIHIFFPLLLTLARPRAINPPAIISAGRHCKPLRFPAEVTMVYLALSCLNRDRRSMPGTECCCQLITPCVGKPS